jgi:hypothetical protein
MQLPLTDTAHEKAQRGVETPEAITAKGIKRREIVLNSSSRSRGARG